MPETSDSDTVYTKQEQIAELAKRHPTMALTSLNHYLDLDWLREAFRRTRKNGAPGVDGQTWADYAANLEENLRSLLERAKSGSYRAPPVRRVWIPKGTGPETRPIGIPTLEDKVLQRAVVMILEAIYEQDFLDCSYGFRPGRSAHQALESLWQQTMRAGGAWILEVDIRKFFDTLASCASTGVSSAEGSRWRATTPDWQVAEGGRDGRRKAQLSGRRIAPGWGRFTRTGQCVSALCARHVVR